MPKLKKAEFDEANRFRGSRQTMYDPQWQKELRLVSCATCNYMTGLADDKSEPAFCEHDERVSKIKLREYQSGFIGKGTSRNVASERVCDAYESKPLPEEVVVPDLPEDHAFLLGTQFADQYHGSRDCPYVIEEARRIATQDTIEGGIHSKRGEISLADLSDMVPGETLRDICEMPCCESKLPFQISFRSDYRQRVGIKPDGTDSISWVRNGIVKHGESVVRDPTGVEIVFDLNHFPGLDSKDVHSKICAAMDYLRANSNMLGSRPLSEANNPIGLHYHHILGGLRENPEKHLELWVYDERLFNWRDELTTPIREGKIRELDHVPEGILPCIDTKDVLDRRLAKNDFSQSSFRVYGAVKPSDDEALLSKRVDHFVEIGALTYHDSNGFMGVYGKGFGAVKRFDAE